MSLLASSFKPCAAAFRGETDRNSLIARIEAVAAKVEAGRRQAGSPLLALAAYLRAVVALLRGEPVLEVTPVFAEHLAAIEEAAREAEKEQPGQRELS